MKQFLLITLLVLSACQNKSTTEYSTKKIEDSLNNLVDSQHTQTDSDKPEEVYIDSVYVGKKQLNKIEILKFRVLDSNYVITRLYSKQKNKWVLKNEFHLEKDPMTQLDVKISDFNNDGMNDLTYVSNIGSRGGNEIRQLFIYTNDRLVMIENSEDYPNILYNKELNCIDAFYLYGGCSTFFLKLNGNILEEFARVELNEDLVVKTFDSDGKESILYKDSSMTSDEGDIRFKNFKPLKKYDYP